MNILLFKGDGVEDLKSRPCSVVSVLGLWILEYNVVYALDESVGLYTIVMCRFCKCFERSIVEMLSDLMKGFKVQVVA
jgi:hypothetical protein